MEAESIISSSRVELKNLSSAYNYCNPLSLRILNIRLSHILHLNHRFGWDKFHAGALNFGSLEIKTLGLGSKIRDMALWDEPNIELLCFWPLGNIN